MLLEKYQPKSAKEILGNRMAQEDIKNFLKGWKKGEALLIAGDSGTGKTLMVRLVCKEAGYDIVEIGADENRGIKEMSALGSASKQTGLLFRKKAFLIDELDQMESGKALLKFIEESSHSVILIATDPYDKKLFSLRRKCRLVKFQKVRSDTIAKFLGEICLKEGLSLNREDLDQISKMSSGDVRAALIDLELLSAHGISGIGYRERSQGIFELLKIIFKTTSMENALIALNNADDPEELHRWIAENIAEEYENIEDIARAFDMISKADIFHSRIIKRQSWSLQRYFFEMSTAGVALAKKQQYHKFVKYGRPKFRRRESSEILEKISRKVHVSSKRAGIYRQLIKKMKNKRMLEELELSKEDLKNL